MTARYKTSLMSSGFYCPVCSAEAVVADPIAQLSHLALTSVSVAAPLVPATPIATVSAASVPRSISGDSAPWTVVG